MKKPNATNRLCDRLLVTVALALTTVATARADYHSTVISDSPLAYYPINSGVDPAGTTATDLSGNGNNGTYNGTTPEFNSVPGPSSFIPNALYFDGFTSFVDLSTGSNPTLLDFAGTITMEAWVQPASPTVGSSRPADILGKGYDGTSEISFRANGGNYSGGIYDNTLGGHGAGGGVQTTNWTYLVSTYDGTRWNFYVNGVLVQANADSVGAVNFAVPWAIGDGTTGTAGDNSGNLRFFTGNLTEVALYNTALSSNQVVNHYFVGKVGVAATASVPIINTQPQSQSSFFGGSVTFSVSAVSGSPMTNQWFKGVTQLVGKTNATLTLTNLSAGDAANYSVVVGNSNGTTNSVSVSLTVSAPNSLKWNAIGTSDVWDTGSSANWLNLGNSQQTVFNTYDQVLFNDTVGVSNNVTVSGTISASVLTVNSSANNYTFSGSGTLSGVGSLVKQGSSLLTIGVPGNFTGPVTISGGTVKTTGNALGSVSSITITNTGALDVSGNYLGNTPIVVSGAGPNGNGAILNSGGDVYGLSSLITLSGNAVFGGPGRWDMENGSTLGTQGKAYGVTVTGTSYRKWNGVNIDPALADIDVVMPGGVMEFNGMTSIGNPTNSLIVHSNSQIVFWGGTSYKKKFVFQDTSSFNSFGGTRTFDGPVVLEGIATFSIGDGTVTFTNVISGAGGFVWNNYNNLLTFSANNTYTGPTAIGNDRTLALTGNGAISQSALIFFGGNNAGSTRVDVTGRTDQTLTLASGQTLGGIGLISGNLAVSTGATLAPAGTNTLSGNQNITGTIAASGNITLSGTTVIKLNGSGNNDALTAAGGGSITYGGTLNLVNVSGSTLVAGDTFQVFNAGTISGSFASIIPPGNGLAWDISQLNTGVISVITAPPQPAINSTVVSGGNLIFSGTNGTAGGTYYVVTSTNVATPLHSWTPLSTNTFGPGGTFSVTNAIIPGTPQRFYLLKLP